MERSSLTALILAAGMGSRLWPLTRHTPKSLIDLGDGSSMLDEQLKIFEVSPGIARTVVVTGHLGDQIEAHVQRRWAGSASTRFNPFYERYGPLGSLWAVLDLISSEPVLIVNGDTILAPTILEGVLQEAGRRDALLVVSETEHLADDDVRALVEGGRVHGVGKLLRVARHRSAGLLAFSSEPARELAVATIERLVRQPAAMAPAAPWHELVNALVAEGLEIAAHEVDDSLWTEVDVRVDIEGLRRRALETVAGFAADSDESQQTDAPG